jgi:hypothetical protein
MKFVMTNTRVLMATLFIAAIGGTFAFAQTIDLFGSDTPSPETVSALLVGNVKVTQFDGDGNIIAVRQGSNNIVETGMEVIMGQVFNTVNDTYAIPSRPVSYMAIGTLGEWRVLYNDTTMRNAAVNSDAACVRVPLTGVVNSTASGGGPSTTWGPEPSPGSCSAPNCAAQMNITASASFIGADCAIASIDEAGIFTGGPANNTGVMFARNTFGEVTLNPLDTLQLDWEFTFTDN